jgi:8-oxo-dGTP pyrophosphatase MutT (NUDIX family)
MNIVSTMIEAHIFRETAKGIEFLLLKRSEYQPYPGLWQMITGKIKPDEQAHRTALREIKEETGLTPAQLWVAPTVNSFYEPAGEYICLLPVFAARVEDEKIKLSAEHTAYQWVDKITAQKLLAWEGQRKAVHIIEDYFLNEKSFFHFVEIKI